MHRAHLAYLARHRGDWQAACSHAQAAIDGWQATEFPLLWLAVLPWLAASLHLPKDAVVLRARLASLLADDQQRLPAALEACCQAVLEATHITPEAVAGVLATADAEGYA